MNARHVILPSPARRIPIVRLALAVAAAWFAVHATLYVVGIWRSNPELYKHLAYVLKHFFGWQAAGFLVVAVAVSTRRPSAISSALGGYLVLSTLTLLAFSHDATMLTRLALLLLWTGCAAEGMRLAIARAAGPRYASWGVALAAVYAALVPVCFVLGVLHAITPPLVAVLAVASATPGAIAGLRRLAAIHPRSHALRGNATGVARSVGSHAEHGNQGLLVAWFLVEVIWAILAVEFVAASTSEVASDATRVHVPYMLRVIADHGISHQYACWYRLQPMAVQTYSAAIAAMGSLAAAKWFSWLALGVLVLLVVEETERRSGSREVGLLAGAALLACPQLAWLSRTLYVDHVLAMLCTAGFVVLFRALRPPCLRGVLLSAAIMGAMIQVKYTGLVFASVWGVFLAIDLLWKRGWRIALRWSAVAAALLIAVGLPWYAYVYLGTGNPFYPYLHGWFPSPYWIDNFTMREVFESTFKLPPGIGGIASFPWLVTYSTARFVEGYDGAMGFLPLALLPCWFFAPLWPVKRGGGDCGKPARSPEDSCGQTPVCTEKSAENSNVPYWDMAIVSVAMIAGILAYTPYVRYWLPAYPLLLASGVLAAGSLARAVSWRPTGRWMPVGVAAALALLLCLPAPILSADVPWYAYAKRISPEEHLARSFPGYEAIQQLNKILAPDDGVLCTAFKGVYLVGGQPYDFECWWNKIHRIHDRDSFAGFCRRYGIRYWMVNPSSSEAQSFRAIAPDVTKEYWHDARLVTAAGTMAVYDVSSPIRPASSRKEQCAWPAVVEKTPASWTVRDASQHWVNLAAAAPATIVNEALALTGPAQIGHRIEPTMPGGVCRVRLGLWSSEPTVPLMEVAWYDAKGSVLAHFDGAGEGKSNFEMSVFAPIPNNAVYGWVYLREWKGKPIHLNRAAATFCQPAREPTLARGETPDGPTGGVR